MRKLKYHEQKLLKKVDLFHWKAHDNTNENIVMRKFHIQERDDYVKYGNVGPLAVAKAFLTLLLVFRYNKLRGLITKLANELSLLPPDDAFRKDVSDELLSKLVQTGLIPIKRDLNQCEKVTVSSFCRYPILYFIDIYTCLSLISHPRRRLPVMLVKLKMAENMLEAVKFVEQGRTSPV